MTEYDNTNSGAIFVNDKNGNENAPDRSGKVNIEGKEYRMSGWLFDREGKRLKTKAGKDYMRVRFTALENQQQASPKSAPKPVADPAFDDEIPFSFAYWIPAGLLGLMVLGASAGQMVA
jgi:hypothetical protein